MTRKDFILIAQTVRAMSLPLVDRTYVSKQFADALEAANPCNFKRDVFLKACGV